MNFSVPAVLNCRSYKDAEEAVARLEAEISPEFFLSF
jgi:hypothetical protein